MTISEQIVITAQGFLGTNEIKGNMGWFNKAFQSLMEKLTGWRMGQHWCAYFMALVWKRAYAEYYKADQLKYERSQSLLNKLCSGNSQKTFKNFKNSAFLTSKTPIVGAAVVWKYSGVSGHTAACIESIDLAKKEFISIEGNAGDTVTRRKHKFGESNLVGFIYPMEF